MQESSGSPLLFLGVLLLFGNLARADAALEGPFTRIRDGEIVNEMAASQCAAWGDYDNDGWLDIVIGHDTTGGRLFRNNQDGSFTKVITDPWLKNTIGFHAAAWGDYDNDGFLDLTVANFFGWRSPIFHNDGQGNLVEVPSKSWGEVLGPAGHDSVAWGDYDSDGLLDLFVGKGGFDFLVADFLYHNNGTNFSNVTNAVTTPRLPTMGASWSDYDNDGDIDLLVSHYRDHGNFLYRNDGAGNFTNVSAQVGLTAVAGSTGSSWGDFDNDGDLDLIIGNYRTTSGPPTRNFLYQNNGDGTFARITDGPIPSAEGYFVSCSWIDFDNDGWLDVFMTDPGAASAAGGRKLLFRNMGKAGFAEVTEGQLAADASRSAGFSWGDYNNDGFPDLFVANGGFYWNQTNSLYRNNTNANAWIKLKCVGTRSNRSAIGTKIRARARIDGEDRWQMRQIVGTEGYLTFNALDVIIGLGKATQIDILRVEWPSGLVEELRNVPVRQTLTLVEGNQAGERLRIARTTDTTVTLNWSSGEYLLESTDDPGRSPWSSIAGLSGTSHETSAIGKQFFRLRRR